MEIIKGFIYWLFPFINNSPISTQQPIQQQPIPRIQRRQRNQRNRPIYKSFNPNTDFFIGSNKNLLSKDETTNEILLDIFQEKGIIKIIENFLPCQYCKCDRCGKEKRSIDCMFYNRGNNDITVYCLEKCT